MIPLLYASAPNKAGSISSINFQKLYPSLEAQTLTFTLLLYFLNLHPKLFTNSE